MFDRERIAWGQNDDERINMIDGEEHCQSSTAPARPYSIWVRPWFMGIAYSAIESGHLDVLDLIVQA
jgi:hypothetical protein